LRVLREKAEARRSPEVVATMHRAVDELRASGAASRVLKPGDRMPDFVLPDGDIASWDSGTCLRGPPGRHLLPRPLVTVLQRRAGSSTEVLPDITALGANLVAISPQLPEHNRELARSRALSFRS